MIASAFAGSPEPWRFNELRGALDISQTTLSARLDDFLEAELITRHAYDEMPPRVEYEATAKLRAAEPVIQDLVAWWRDESNLGPQ